MPECLLSIAYDKSWPFFYLFRASLLFFTVNKNTKEGKQNVKEGGEFLPESGENSPEGGEFLTRLQTIKNQVIKK